MRFALVVLLIQAFGFLQSVTADAQDLIAPYPPSPVIRGVTWAPQSEIIRLAKDSDNWPTAWAEDGSFFTIYGDGHGFQPPMPRKLSLGVAQVFGVPPDLRAVNIPTVPEFLGDGPRGYKASGLLMLQGTLYMFRRNLGPSRLLISSDRGQTWTETGAAFEQSFGCPTFLNFGPNGTRSRDDFIYVYSSDSPNAYDAADQMVLSRVPRSKLADKTEYEYFRALDPKGKPTWTHKIENRGAVFSFPDHCYRSGITYNPALKRYLWCQILPQSKHPQGPRFEGGFGIYDGPEPWGPWSTVYFTSEWDVGPGETSSFPPGWISADGQTLYLLFSGDDSFSVRKVRFTISSP